MDTLAPLRRWILVVAAAGCLAACGAATRVVYDNSGAAVLLSADRHLDLEGPQWKITRAAIARFHAWHRQQELPRYAALLDDAAARVHRGLGRADVEWGLDNVRKGYVAIVAEAVADSAPLLDTLDARNLETLQRHFADEDRKRVREHLSGPPEKRQRERVAAIVKRFESWTGPLAPAQVELIRKFVAGTAEFPQYAHNLRLARQRELVELLDRGVRNDGVQPDALKSLFVAWALEPTPERRQRDELFVQLLVELDRSLTPAQRARAVERLTGYAEDARILGRSKS